MEYDRQTEEGLANQGWKDSHDSIFHADGALAAGPIALAEVQGYVYAARRAAAEIARQLGLGAEAEALDARAAALRVAFEAAFWCEDIGTYALALDGQKRPCRVRASNAGHLLLTGIAAPGQRGCYGPCKGGTHRLHQPSFTPVTVHAKCGRVPPLHSTPSPREPPQ